MPPSSRERLVGLEIRLQRDRGDHHLFVEQHQDALVEALVKRIEEMLGTQRHSEFFEQTVVDQHRAEERRLGLEIGGQRAAGGGFGGA